MDTKLLEAFIALAEELHFTRAAERLGIQQPVMSQRIRRLEAGLGAALVERSTRSVRLTPAGRAALPHARKTVEYARSVLLAATGDGSPVLGRVVLGYAGASLRNWLPTVARTVRAQAPGVDLALRNMVFSRAAPDLVSSGELDLAFGRRPLRVPGLRERVFEYERLLVALPSDHPLAAADDVSVADLAADRWVTLPESRGSSVRSAGMRVAQAAGFTPRVVQEAPDSYTLMGLVAAGVGVTITVSSVAHVATPGMVMLPLRGVPHHLAATVIWRERPEPAERAVLEVLEQIMPTPDRPKGIILDG